MVALVFSLIAWLFTFAVWRLPGAIGSAVVVLVIYIFVGKGWAEFSVVSIGLVAFGESFLDQF